ncbi:LysR family transcriptional regulator [Burkholderia anthina]|uniref:LysR family transcriptional regulator n=1 Tax=Burkholderia anthina TaxID=179879 RepID=UPI002729A8C7
MLLTPFETDMSHLTHLRTFLDAYRLKSFSKAADRLGITQPAASMHIQALETLVGKPLFVRRARGVLPTEAADELARSVAPFLDGLETKLASYQTGATPGGTLHIAGPSDFICAHVASTLAPLMAQGFLIRFHIGNRDRIYQLLNDGTADLAITASMPDAASYGFARLLTERFLLVMAPELAERVGKHPTAETLSALPIVAYDEDLALIRPVWTSLFQVAPTIQASLTIPDLRIIERLVAGGHGWTVLPDYLCAESLASGRLVALTAPETAPTNNLYLVWSQNAMRTPRIVHARDYLLQAFNAS